MDGALILMAYGVIGMIVIGLGVFFWARSAASRKVYRCPQCREVIEVELMKASRCNMCGAPLDIANLHDDQYDDEDN